MKTSKFSDMTEVLNTIAACPFAVHGTGRLLMPFVLACLGGGILSVARAQTPTTTGDALADSLRGRLTVRVTHDSAGGGEPVAGAVLQTGANRVQTDAQGLGTLR